MDAPLPDRRELRSFGLQTGAAIAVLFGLLLPLLFGRHLPRWPWAIGGALIAAALIHPPVLRYVHQVWTRIGHALGWINSRVLLGLLFYLVLTPAGNIARWRGHDPLRRKYDPHAASYREPVEARDPRHMEKPF